MHCSLRCRSSAPRSDGRFVGLTPVSLLVQVGPKKLRLRKPREELIEDLARPARNAPPAPPALPSLPVPATTAAASGSLKGPPTLPLDSLCGGGRSFATQTDGLADSLCLCLCVHSAAGPLSGPHRSTVVSMGTQTSAKELPGVLEALQEYFAPDVEESDCADPECGPQCIPICAPICIPQRAEGPSVCAPICIPQRPDGPSVCAPICIPQRAEGPSVCAPICIPQRAEGPSVCAPICIPQRAEGPSVCAPICIPQRPDGPSVCAPICIPQRAEGPSVCAPICIPQRPEGPSVCAPICIPKRDCAPDCTAAGTPTSPVDSESSTDSDSSTAAAAQPCCAVPPPRALALPPGWRCRWDGIYRRYSYIDTRNGTTQWDPPAMPATQAAKSAPYHATSTSTMAGPVKPAAQRRGAARGQRGAPGMHERGGASEAAPAVVRQAVGGGCQSGWGRLLSVTNTIEAGACRQGDSGWA